MIRAVVDTNLYVSALVFGGKPAAVIQLADEGAFELVVCAQIRDELAATLTRKFGWSSDRVRHASDVLWNRASWVVPPQLPPASRDRDDDFILACALEAGAGFVVTGDQDLLALHPFRGIAVFTPADFLARLSMGSR
ncbi:MAG TPA: putative toxin-antitoxin system toxin component, PIN family [Bryobacteraceae bacterium]